MFLHRSVTGKNVDIFHSTCLPACATSDCSPVISDTFGLEQSCGISSVTISIHCLFAMFQTHVHLHVDCGASAPVYHDDHAFNHIVQCSVFFVWQDALRKHKWLHHQVPEIVQGAPSHATACNQTPTWNVIFLNFGCFPSWLSCLIRFNDAVSAAAVGLRGRNKTKTVREQKQTHARTHTNAHVGQRGLRAVQLQFHVRFDTLFEQLSAACCRHDDYAGPFADYARHLVHP